MRLADFDYSEHGAYFVTICTQNRVALFGSVVGDEMRSNAAGRMIEQWWAKLPGKFAHVEIDEFVVMPNHVHGLLFINGADVAVHEPPELSRRGRTHRSAPTGWRARRSLASCNGSRR